MAGNSPAVASIAIASRPTHEGPGESDALPRRISAISPERIAVSGGGERQQSLPLQEGASWPATNGEVALGAQQLVSHGEAGTRSDSQWRIVPVTAAL